RGYTPRQTRERTRSRCTSCKAVGVDNPRPVHPANPLPMINPLAKSCAGRSVERSAAGPRRRVGSALLETAEFYVKKSGVLLPMLGEDFRLAQLDAPALDAYVRARRDEGTRDHDVVILPREASRTSRAPSSRHRTSPGGSAAP